MSSREFRRKWITKLVGFVKKRFPLYLFLVILPVFAMVSTGVYSAILEISTRTITTIGGEVFDITEELIMTPQGINITLTDTDAIGDISNPVIMISTGASANTDLIQGHFEYRLKVEIDVVSGGDVYIVELYADGSSMGTVYIEQDSGAVVNDYVIIKWDLGSSIDDSVYEIQIVET